MKKDITELFCFVDDFSKGLEEEIKSHQLENNKISRHNTRIPGLIDSEIMTILLMFQESPCRNFKYFYKSYLQLYRPEFPKMPCYDRFLTLMPRVLHLLVFMLYCLFSPGKGTAYVDSTSLAVCHPKRISRNKVFKGLASRGKTTKGWFFGFSVPQIYAGEVRM
jgi:Transposase DDE domain